MTQTFPREKRLLTGKQFERVFKSSKKIVMPAFLVLVSENQEDRPRIGFALSKKYLPKASLRNKIRRIFRESFRRQFLASVDLVVLARKGLDSMEGSALRLQLDETWKKVNKLYGYKKT